MDNAALHRDGAKLISGNTSPTESAPDSQEMNALLTLFSSGQLVETEMMAREMAERFPRHGLCKFAWGETLLHLGRNAEALVAMQSAAQLLPGAPEVHNSLGLNYRFLNSLDEAETAFRYALTLNPEYTDAHNNLGTTLRDLGRLQQAQTCFQYAIQVNPDYADAHYNLGITLRELGCLEQAVLSFGRAVAINAAYVEAHINLGIALRDLRRFDESEAGFRRALQIKPENAEAHYHLGLVLSDMDRLGEAESSYRRTIEIRPDHAEAHNNLGNALLNLERLDEAEASYRNALRAKPDYPDAHNNLGVLLRAQGRLAEAEASSRRAIEVKPDNANAHNNLGITLHDLGRLDEAEAHYLLALEIEPGLAEAYNNLGVTQYDQGQLLEAKASYLKAIEIAPEFAAAHCNLGSTLVALGSIGPAHESLSRAIELAPGEAEPLSTALSFIQYRRDDPRFAQLDAIYSRRQSLPLDTRVRLNFAMGKAMENIGQYERSFEAYEEGNRLHSQFHPFNESNEQRILEERRQFFSADLFEKFATPANLSLGMEDLRQDPRVPIFIVGMPRSGTTLIEQILASHPCIYGAGEVTTLGEIVKEAEIRSLDSTDPETTLSSLRKLGLKYLDQIWKLAPDSRCIINKMPSNYNRLGLIHLMLPNAKIIHAMRDPMDTCFSCYSLRFRHGHEYSYDLPTLGRTYLRYRTLMAHWHKVLPPGQILDLQYEDNVKDPEREARRLLDYLALPWDPACLKFFESGRIVKTASATQVRRPIYSSAIARWKNFSPHLMPLIETISMLQN